MNETILIVEDDLDIIEVLTQYLTAMHYNVFTATSATAAKKIVQQHAPQLIILDVQLPDEDGFTFAKAIRHNSSAMILFLTANTDLEHKLAGFAAGGDDYVTKPFAIREVVARIEALLKRSSLHDNLLAFGSLIIDIDRMTVIKNNLPVPLYTKEKQLLIYLAKNANKVVSTEQLLNTVWGYDSITDNKTLAVHISMLRRKIEDDPSQPIHIKTVRGFGYMFATPS